MGKITETATSFPGYTGVLPDEVAGIGKMMSYNGYSTAAYGKWHETAVWEISPSGPMTRWPNHQGFDFAAFPIHQQGQLTVFHDDSAHEEVSIGIGKTNYDDRYTMDEWLRTDASAMVTGVEGERGENVREVVSRSNLLQLEVSFRDQLLDVQELQLYVLRPSVESKS